MVTWTTLGEMPLTPKCSAGSGADAYLGMMQTDTRLIVEALR